MSPRSKQPFGMATFENLYTGCTTQLREENGNGSAPSTDAVLQCVAESLSGDRGSREFARLLLLIYSAALVFFMQAGFAMVSVCGGSLMS